MLFLNSIFMFLFVLVPLHLIASEPPHIQSSRNSSPVVKIAVAYNRVPVLYYEYPGSKDVYFTFYACPGSESHETGYGRHSVPAPIPAREVNISLASESKSSSLPDQSKLDTMRAANAEVLTQSNERLDLLKTQIADASQSTLEKLAQFISQKLTIAPENPSK
jgi:hypothetical protein